MKRIYLISVSLFCFFLYTRNICAFRQESVESFTDDEISQRTANAEWAVVGAGPAGILAVGMLLDAGVAPTQIIWIDPEFQVGRLGKYYSTVPANSATRLFLLFINACETFKACNSSAMQYLRSLDPGLVTELSVIVEPLKDVTTILRSRVQSLRDTVQMLDFMNNKWMVTTNFNRFSAQHVILALGSHPKTLNYLKDNQIPLDLAFNKEILAQRITAQDKVALVGDGHSAYLILKHLTEIPTGHIIHFFKRKLSFASDPETAGHGLLGLTAEWAKEVLVKNPPVNLVTIKSSPESLRIWTPLCTKIIYAIGYETNPLPLINGKSTVSYDPKTGSLMPRLFGFGIAFPEHYIPEPNTTQDEAVIKPSIGLHLFLQHLQEMLPQWIQSKLPSTRHLLGFEDLFRIDEVHLMDTEQSH